MFRTIPEDLSALSLNALNELRVGLKADAAKLAADNAGKIPPESAADVRTARLSLGRLEARIKELSDAQAEFEGDVDALFTEETPEAEPELEAGDEDEADEPEADEDDDDDADDDEATASAGAPAIVKVKTQAAPARKVGLAKTGTKPAPKKVTGSQFVAAGGVQGMEAGDAFSDTRALSSALLESASRLQGGADRRVTIGSSLGHFDRTFSNDPTENLDFFRGMREADDEVRAAFCAPATPHYELSCWNTDRRPVFNSLPGFAAPRGVVSIYPSPTLSDIDTGFGIWTDTDDLNPSAVKSTCQTIDCADSDTYKLYGVYRCLTVKNLLALTFPELVDAYLNRLAAATARLAEKQHLNAMGAEATVVNGNNLDYNGTTSVITSILHLVTLWTEQERWDLEGSLHAWMPRWVKNAMKMDLYRRRNTAGGTPKFASDAEIESMFRDAGINGITWFIDTPTWAPTIPLPQVGGSIQTLPTRVPFLVAPEGKFAAIDRGNLTVGVASNNIYRDNTSNSKNEFTMFFEAFEGLVNTDSCPAYLMQIPACWNGVQIADITAPECDGTTSGS